MIDPYGLIGLAEGCWQLFRPGLPECGRKRKERVCRQPRSWFMSVVCSAQAERDRDLRGSRRFRPLDGFFTHFVGPPDQETKPGL